MATDLQFLLNGVPSVPPTEWEKMELQLNWDNSDNLNTSLSTSQFTFEGQTAHDIIDHINSTAVGKGIFVGPKYEITSCTNQTILKGCIDTAAAEASYTCSSVTLPVRDNRIDDLLTDKKDSFSFAYLASLPANAAGRISSADYRLVPYCISSIPDYNTLMSTAITLFLVTKEIAEIIRKTADIVAELAVPPVSLVGAVKLILQAAYLVIMIAATINLVQTLIDCIIQPKKYKKGMYCRTLFQKACAYMGWTFSSTILNQSNGLYYRAAIIPKKITQPNANFIGFKRAADESTTTDSYGYYDGTFGQFIYDMEQIFNAKAVLKGTTLFFERIDHWNIYSSITLPNLDLTGINNGSYKYNAHELSSNYYFSWQLDNNELNTYDHYEGTSCQMQASVTGFTDQTRTLLQGLTEKRPALSLGKRKEVLTGPEKVLNTIINIMTFFTGLSPIPNRIGWLLLSNDFTGNPKFVILDSGDKIATNNKTLTSATYLMNNYHNINFPLNDQWLVYEGWEIPFCCDDYVAVMNSNFITTFDNRLGKITNLRWQMGSDTALIDFKVKPQGGTYTTNITQTIITDLR
jgi:hypothetical protein